MLVNNKKLNLLNIKLTPVHKTFNELKIKSDHGCQTDNIAIMNIGLRSTGWAAWPHCMAEAKKVKIFKILL